MESRKEGSIVFVAHNAIFDMNVIRGCCDYYGMPVPEAQYACTLQIARKAWKDFKRHRLTHLAERFGIVYDAHNALDDSRTCGKILSLAAKELGLSEEALFAQKKILKNL